MITLLNLKQNSITRKLRTFTKQIPRKFIRCCSSSTDYSVFFPILVNSFPKSGTHLLLQVLNSLPEHKNFGTFIASTPSVTFRERSERQHLQLFEKIVPGEVIPAHLYFNPDYENFLSSINCIHFFIYRDLRDVAISEAYYLTYMNRWHRMHPHYKKEPNQNARISLAISGIDNDNFSYSYPNIAKRFQRYAGWLKSKNVLALKFEDLIGDNRRNTIEKIMKFYATQTNKKINIDQFVEIAMTNIDPQKSHTFRKGKIQQWKKIFTEKHCLEIEKVASQLLNELDYSDTK